MATYRADMGQAPNPSSPSGAGQRLAAQARGTMFETVLGAAETAYKGYLERELGGIEEAAAALPREALAKGKAASDAKTALVGVNEGLRAAQHELSGQAGPTSPELEEELKGKIGGYLERAQALRAAADGGMKPTEYMQRVEALTKSAVVRFPGLQKEIRSLIGKATGLPNADDTPAMWYVREMFEKREEPKSSKHRTEDIQTISKHLAVSQEYLESIYDTPEYISLRNKAYDIAGVEQAAAQAQARAKAGFEIGGPEQQRAVYDLALAASASSAVEVARWQAIPENAAIITGLAAAVQKGDLAAMGAAEAQFNVMKGQVGSLISKSFRQARATLMDAYGRRAISPEQYEQSSKLLDDREKFALGMFDEKNIGNTVTILSKFRDKSIQEQSKRIELASQFFALYGDATLVKAWFANKPDSKERTAIKRDTPALAAQLETFENDILNGASQGMALLGNGFVLQTTATMTDAQNNGGPSPATPVVPSVTPDQQRAALEAVAVSGGEVWKKLKKEGAVGLSRVDINVLSTMLNNGIEYNQPIPALRAGVEDERVLFAKLPSAERDAVRAAVAATTSVNSEKVVAATQQINTMFGVALEIGVRSDGTIGVVPPMNLIVSNVQRQVGTDVPFGIFNKYPELKYKAVKHGAEEEFRKYEQAAKMWEQTQAARANNMVLGRSVTNNEDATAVGKEIAGYLAAGKSVPLFFSAAPTGVSLGENVGVSLPEAGVALQGSASTVARDLQMLIDNTKDDKVKRQLQAVLNDMKKGQ